MGRHRKVGVEPGQGTRANVPDDQCRAVQKLVCKHARDAADGHLLLDVLGLLPDPDEESDDPG